MDSQDPRSSSKNGNQPVTFICSYYPEQDRQTGRKVDKGRLLATHPETSQQDTRNIYREQRAGEKKIPLSYIKEKSRNKNQRRKEEKKNPNQVSTSAVFPSLRPPPTQCPCPCFNTNDEQRKKRNNVTRYVEEKKIGNKKEKAETSLPLACLPRPRWGFLMDS